MYTTHIVFYSKDIIRTDVDIIYGDVRKIQTAEFYVKDAITPTQSAGNLQHDEYSIQMLSYAGTSYSVHHSFKKAGG